MLHETTADKYDGHSNTGICFLAIGTVSWRGIHLSGKIFRLFADDAALNVPKLEGRMLGILRFV